MMFLIFLCLFVSSFATTIGTSIVYLVIQPTTIATAHFNFLQIITIFVNVMSTSNYKTTGNGEYDPWLNYNNDGQIESFYDRAKRILRLRKNVYILK
jgi:hypothetical protein